MPNIETSKPSLYGEIDQAVIYTLREEALKMWPPQFYERWTTEKRSSKKGLKRHKALGPLLEMVLDCATQSGYSPRAIDFDIDAHDVKQDSAQRMTGEWHVDGGPFGLRTRLVVADCLPTQILVASSNLSKNGAGIEPRALEDMKRTKLFPPDTELDLMGLEIYTPPTHRLVDIGNRLHRSPMNITKDTVQRTFIRANLIA